MPVSSGSFSLPSTWHAMLVHLPVKEEYGWRLPVSEAATARMLLSYGGSDAFGFASRFGIGEGSQVREVCDRDALPVAGREVDETPETKILAKIRGPSERNLPDFRASAAREPALQ